LHGDLEQKSFGRDPLQAGRHEQLVAAAVANRPAVEIGALAMHVGKLQQCQQLEAPGAGPTGEEEQLAIRAGGEFIAELNTPAAVAPAIRHIARDVVAGREASAGHVEDQIRGAGTGLERTARGFGHGQSQLAISRAGRDAEAELRRCLVPTSGSGTAQKLVAAQQHEITGTAGGVITLGGGESTLDVGKLDANCRVGRWAVQNRGGDHERRHFRTCTTGLVENDAAHHGAAGEDSGARIPCPDRKRPRGPGKQDDEDSSGRAEWIEATHQSNCSGINL
jgi:hypothetical protein